MERPMLAGLLSVVALLTLADVAHGAARAFSRSGKDTTMKTFQSLNPSIQWDTWHVNLAGVSTNCADVGRQGAVTITKRSKTPDGNSFAGFVDSTPGDRKDSDSVTKYINTVIGGWTSRYEFRNQIEQARKVGCAVRPGCRGNALIVCVFSPAVGGSPYTGRERPNNYNQPGRVRPAPERERPDDRYSIQPVAPPYNQPGRDDDTYRQPYDPRYPRREQPDDRYSAQPVNPYQPEREEDTFRIQPVDPRYQPRREQPDDRYSAQPVNPYQPDREEDTFRIQPVDPRYQPRREQPDDRYSAQPVNPYQPGGEEDTFRIQPVDSRAGNYPGGQGTFDNAEDSHLLSRKEARRLRKEEKKRRKQQARNEEADIYDRMISDGMMMGDDPNAQLGLMDQDEFQDYLRKYGSDHPQHPQHLKKADGTMSGQPNNRRKETEKKPRDTDVREAFADEQRHRGDVFYTQDNVRDEAEKPDSVALSRTPDVTDERNRDNRDIVVVEPLARRVEVDRNPSPVVEATVESQSPRAFTEEQRVETAQLLEKQWDRTHFLENLSAMEADCKMLNEETWPFSTAQNEGRRKGYDLRSFYSKTYNRGSTQDAIRLNMNEIATEMALFPDNSMFGCSVIPDCVDGYGRMQVVVVCIMRVESRPHHRTS